MDFCDILAAIRSYNYDVSVSLDNAYYSTSRSEYISDEEKEAMRSAIFDCAKRIYLTHLNAQREEYENSCGFDGFADDVSWQMIMEKISEVQEMEY